MCHTYDQHPAIAWVVGPATPSSPDLFQNPAHQHQHKPLVSLPGSTPSPLLGDDASPGGQNGDLGPALGAVVPLKFRLGCGHDGSI